jgi:DNA-binding response OmpR family regulator
MPDSLVSRNGVVIALPADLIFGARIRATAEAVGASVIIARSPEDLLAKLRDTETRMVILDLDRRGLGISDTVKQIKAASTAPLLAYVSHTNEAAIRDARAAGADKVIARGAFAQQLPDLLKTF